MSNFHTRLYNGDLKLEGPELKDRKTTIEDRSLVQVIE